MVNVTLCDKCIHYKVCGIKDGYNKYINAVNDVAIHTQDSGIWYAKDCKDLIIDVGCQHFQKPQPNIK